MKIKIKQCSDTNKGSIEYWYRNKIGQEFEVRWEVYNYLFVTNDRGANFVNKKDVS